MSGALFLAAAVLACAQSGADDPRAPHRGLPEQDVLSYSITLRLDPSRPGLDGSCVYEIRADGRDLDQVRLHALRGEDYATSFATEDGAALAAEHDGEAWVVQLPSTLPAGETVRFRSSFAGTPVDGIYWSDSRDGDAYVYTDHFPARARGWLPCEDHPSDRAAFTVAVTVPNDTLQVACTGALSTTAGDDGVTWTARTKSDVSAYMLAIAVGPYDRLAEDGDPRLEPHYVYRRDKAKARRALKWHAAWMDEMEAHFGPYAYAKYTTVQVPTRWGGMENPGNVWLMERIFDGGDRGVGTLAHEFAHMWFGDAVGYARWDDAWLSEGFASYFGPWLHERAGGGPSLRGAMQANRRRWLGSAAGRERPIRWRDWQDPGVFFGSSSVNTYSKGALVLNMLRAELGDEAFFAGLERYVQEHAGTAVVTEDLVASLEAETGRELGWFFEQWIDRPDCPHLRFTWSDDRLVVEQAQDAAPFRFKLPLRWVDARGETVDVVVDVTERRTEIPIAHGPVRSPAVDPEVTLLYRRAEG